MRTNQSAKPILLVTVMLSPSTSFGLLLNYNQVRNLVIVTHVAALEVRHTSNQFVIQPGICKARVLSPPILCRAPWNVQFSANIFSEGPQKLV